MENKSKEIEMKKVGGVTLCYIPDEQWACPKCGTRKPGILVYDPNYEYEEAPLADEGWLVMKADVECEALVDGDQCGWYGTVRQVYNQLTKKNNLVECPCCKGRGVVTSKVAEKFKR
jgi:hypothetical protein